MSNEEQSQSHPSTTCPKCAERYKLPPSVLQGKTVEMSIETGGTFKAEVTLPGGGKAIQDFPHTKLTDVNVWWCAECGYTKNVVVQKKPGEF